MSTQGSSPTVHASWPGSRSMTSPGPIVISSPSSGLTVIRPDRQSPVWWTWQESVPAIGLTSSDQRQPGSKTPRPRVKSPRVTTSMWPWARNGRRSCGAPMFCLSDMRLLLPLVSCVRAADLRSGRLGLGCPTAPFGLLGSGLHRHGVDVVGGMAGALVDPLHRLGTGSLGQAEDHARLGVRPCVLEVPALA